jgi:hypothetical protein
VQVTERVHVDAPGVTEVFERTFDHLLGGLKPHAPNEFLGRSPAEAYARLTGRDLTGRRRRIRSARARDVDRRHGYTQLERRSLCDQSTLGLGITAVEGVAADRQAVDLSSKGTQPLQSVLGRGGPVGVCHDADAEPEIGGLAHSAEQHRVEQTRFTTLEVNPLDRAKLATLFQDGFDLGQGHRAPLPRASPHETVVALEVALVRQQEVQSREFHSDRLHPPIRKARSARSPA